VVELRYGVGTGGGGRDCFGGSDDGSKVRSNGVRHQSGYRFVPQERLMHRAFEPKKGVQRRGAGELGVIKRFHQLRSTANTSQGKPAYKMRGLGVLEVGFLLVGCADGLRTRCSG
jgi:hypothetical protein